MARSREQKSYGLCVRDNPTAACAVIGRFPRLLAVLIIVRLVRIEDLREIRKWIYARIYDSRRESDCEMFIAVFSPLLTDPSDGDLEVPVLVEDVLTEEPDGEVASHRPVRRNQSAALADRRR